MIPDDWRARAPAMTERAWRGLARILQHPDAPRYNRTLGDRVGPTELAALERPQGKGASSHHTTAVESVVTSDDPRGAVSSGKPAVF
jgi:hypothetical protein